MPISSENIMRRSEVEARIAFFLAEVLAGKCSRGARSQLPPRIFLAHHEFNNGGRQHCVGRMSKREWEEGGGGGDGDGDDRPPKRVRAERQAPIVEEIHYARQLQQFLSFRQDGIPQLRNGIASFKNFLEAILYHRDEEGRARQISILREYLDSQKPADAKNAEQPLLAQLWQAWSFANQNNNDRLASAVSAVIALLLKTLSGELALREYGILLCRTVLQHQHLRILKRCLDAPQHKDFLISPSLRLITEVATFDGGVLAASTYRKRELSFDLSTIRRCLGLVKLDLSEEDAKRRPSIRTLTLRYIIALMKYLPPRDKIDLLQSRPLCSSLFHFLRDDPADLVNELLATVEHSILKDGEVVRSAKAALLTPQNLEKVTEIATRSAEDHPASVKAFAWLKAVCTTPSYGILRHNGWYPPRTTSLNSRAQDGSIDLGLESIDFYDRPGAIEVRNPTLLSWILTLRAHNNLQERELLLSCFQAAPELVAAYFNDRIIQLDPKLSNTWIAYASLLFEIVNLPVPPEFAAGEEPVSLPPQTRILIDNVLPRPFTQQILTRCLNQSSELITFFAVRILVVAFQKLGTVLQQLHSKTEDNRALWDEAAERLKQLFVDRCPAMKDVIQVYRKLADDDDHAMQREAVSRLLQLYYVITPSQASEEQFDVSSSLTTALLRSEKADTDAGAEVSGLRNLELQHLLNIAQYSTGMKWFHKQGGLSYSPITTLLRIHRLDPRNKQLRHLVEHVLVENGLVSSGEDGSTSSATTALVASTTHLEDESVVWDFLDDLLGRGSRKPVKYIDDLEQLVPGAPLPSMLSAVVLEQASFVKAGDKSESKPKAAWIQLFLDLLRLTSNNGDVLDKVVKKINKDLGSLLQSSSQDIQGLLAGVHFPSEIQQDPTNHSDEDKTSHPQPLPFNPPPPETTTHPELSRWHQKDLDLAITDGDITALILNLSSPTSPSLRIQSHIQLTKLHHTLKTSSSSSSLSENSTQISLLIGELLETYPTNSTSSTPLPYLATTFATHALKVLTNPTHFLYPKVNKFLMRGPEWRVRKLAGFWLDFVTSSSSTENAEEEEEGHFWKEIAWVLEWFVDGLRTRHDLDCFFLGGRGGNGGKVFERILGLGMSPAGAAVEGRGKVKVRERILELVFRATCVEGGGWSLGTRMGVLGWLDMVGREENWRRDVVEGLKEKILEGVEGERLKGWMGVRNMKDGALQTTSHPPSTQICI
ncbi:uncharacterized protein MYCFIDRAFT_208945 [Pseudocercospora fijiensis CIRAD86]|uniref:Nucleolar pre-ribosomal-associated protein 1 N-terminal domain-containing protein n=1 Tax=Pseudocercospora fijiensis (strain CIRAD86) TaxID=383855 RepID=M2YKU3_PSEFD|nr:uncharacterized protein MYCFIDRAFT_208945 [Pseudocercospora fijiensis CIRAD86]EME78345.1 hypothetical protein MYCFIDRAFT_208945 [Pseudocercospora fijiensis CIRAD86]